MIFSVQAKNLVFIAVKKAFFRARFDITDVSQFSCNVRVFQMDDCVFLITFLQKKLLREEQYFDFFEMPGI